MRKQTLQPNPEEFSYGFNSSVSGNNHHSVSRHSRKEKLTECRVTVKDKITGTEELHIIPEGNYSKKEMQKLKEKIFIEAITSLYKKRK